MSRFPWANKELGQHFLSNQKVIDQITSAVETGFDHIVEVGPGPGILTEHLSKKGIDISLIEMDQRFITYLEEFVEKDHIFLEDALKFDWQDFLKDKTEKKIWLVSNLPYNISVPLTLQFFQIPQIQFMSLMYQKEVGEKFYPPVNQKNSMNSLSFLAETFFEVGVVAKVSPGSFTPPPKVNSIVLNFIRKQSPQLPPEAFKEIEKFLRLAFSEKRKQLKKLLKKKYPLTAIETALNELQIEQNIRAEALTYTQLKGLYEKL